MNKKTEILAYAVKCLKSEECHCGDTKKVGRSFCYTCYVKLPRRLQKPLWQKVGHGYEEAYEEACLYLDEEN